LKKGKKKRWQPVTGKKKKRGGERDEDVVIHSPSPRQEKNTRTTECPKEEKGREGERKVCVTSGESPARGKKGGNPYCAASEKRKKEKGKLYSSLFLLSQRGEKKIVDRRGGGQRRETSLPRKKGDLALKISGKKGGREKSRIHLLPLSPREGRKRPISGGGEEGGKRGGSPSIFNNTPHFHGEKKGQTGSVCLPL